MTTSLKPHASVLWLYLKGVWTCGRGLSEKRRDHVMCAAYKVALMGLQEYEGTKGKKKVPVDNH